MFWTFSCTGKGPYQLSQSCPTANAHISLLVPLCQVLDPASVVAASDFLGLWLASDHRSVLSSGVVNVYAQSALTGTDHRYLSSSVAAGESEGLQIKEERSQCADKPLQLYITQMKRKKSKKRFQCVQQRACVHQQFKRVVLDHCTLRASLFK